MNTPSDDKAETTITSVQPAQVPEKSTAQGELNEEELNKVSGGAGRKAGGSGSSGSAYLGGNTFPT
jgi:bacteriocin-like protein